MKRNASSPAAYRADVTGVQRDMLETIRTVVLEVAPGTEETIEYGMLSYPGICSLAAQKHYVAVYTNPGVLHAERERFAGIDQGKSCLRFKRPEQIDQDSLAALFRARLALDPAVRGKTHIPPRKKAD